MRNILNLKSLVMNNDPIYVVEIGSKALDKKAGPLGILVMTVSFFVKVV